MTDKNSPACPICAGTGYTMFNHVRKACETCNGTGQLSKSTETAPELKPVGADTNIDPVTVHPKGQSSKGSATQSSMPTADTSKEVLAIIHNYNHAVYIESWKQADYWFKCLQLVYGEQTKHKEVENE